MRAWHPYVPRPDVPCSSSTILALSLAMLLPLGTAACGGPPPDGSPPQERSGLTPASDSWTSTGTPLAEAQPVTVWYHLPEGLSADAPVIMVMQTVLLADRDNDPEASNLRNTDGAQARGPHRFARGHHYFEVARERARELGVEFGWQLDTVPDVAHEFRRMTLPAAAILVP